jgi:hypothetical protein
MPKQQSRKPFVRPDHSDSPRVDIEAKIQEIFARESARKQSPEDGNKSPLWFLSYDPITGIVGPCKPQQS